MRSDHGSGDRTRCGVHSAGGLAWRKWRAVAAVRPAPPRARSRAGGVASSCRLRARGTDPGWHGRQHEKNKMEYADGEDEEIALDTCW